MCFVYHQNNYVLYQLCLCIIKNKFIYNDTYEILYRTYFNSPHVYILSSVLSSVS